MTVFRRTHLFSAALTLSSVSSVSELPRTPLKERRVPKRTLVLAPPSEVNLLLSPS